MNISSTYVKSMFEEGEETAAEIAFRVPVLFDEFKNSFDYVVGEVEREEEEEGDYKDLLKDLPTERNIDAGEMTRFCCMTQKKKGELRDEREWNNPEVNFYFTFINLFI